MSVPLLAYFLSSESLLLFHHYHLLHPPHHQHLITTTSLHCFTGKHRAELLQPHMCSTSQRLGSVHFLDFLGGATFACQMSRFFAAYFIHFSGEHLTLWQSRPIWHKSRLSPCLHMDMSWGCALICNNCGHPKVIFIPVRICHVSN